MKRTKRDVQHFGLTYEELYQLGYQTVKLMVTDLEEFSKYGVSQEEIDNLKALSENFKNRTYDAVNLVAQKQATEIKNQKAEELKGLLSDLEVKLRMFYGHQSRIYNIFELKALGKLNDNELKEKARTAARLFNGFFSQELRENFSDQEIELLKKTSDDLEELITEKNAIHRERLLATSKRIESANELYKAISRIRYVGKHMWADKDPVKRETYMMPNLLINSYDEQDEILNEQETEQIS